MEELTKEELTKEEVFKKIKLTKKQNEAWEDLVKSFKKCEKSGILFYSYLETLTPLNGKHVARIDEAVEERGFYQTDPLCPSSHILPSYLNYGLDGFADDTHKIILKD